MGSHPVILIRADANSEIATGHMMRCLTIADALRQQHAAITFVFSDEESASVFVRFLSIAQIDEPFSYEILHTDYRKLETELDLLKDLILQKNADLVLVDSYFVTKPYLNEISKCCKCAYLDDLMMFDYPVDYVINYDLYPDVSFYKQAKQKLLGSAYTPLRKQFTDITYDISKKVNHILISTGGTDPYHLALQLLENVRCSDFGETLASAHYHIIASTSHPDYEKLQDLAQSNDLIHIETDVEDMAALMSYCDIAITAGGTTLYELCAVSVPTICYSMADNQIAPVKDFVTAGCCVYAGDCRNNPAFVSELTTLLLDLYQDYEKRFSLHSHMKQIIDGNGARRIADVLCQV